MKRIVVIGVVMVALTACVPQSQHDRFVALSAETLCMQLKQKDLTITPEVLLELYKKHGFNSAEAVNQTMHELQGSLGAEQLNKEVLTAAENLCLKASGEPEPIED